MTSVLDFARMKAAGRKISLVTAYDAWSARLVARSNVDAVLVGDSLAMVVHGHPTTIGATVEMMRAHTRAVASAAGDKFLIADLPFLAHRKGIRAAMSAVEALMRAGAHAVKIEGVDGHQQVIQHIVGSGVPVMGHLGLTPQAVHQLGGFRVQARGTSAAASLVRQARLLEECGCFSVVLECIPDTVAAQVTQALRIPTIGIGAGAWTDGQVLVLQDLWGVSGAHAPRFTRRYLDGETLLTEALNRYDEDVKSQTFPAAEEAYH